MDFFDLSEGPHSSGDDVGEGRHGKKEEVRMGSTNGSKESGGDVGKDESVSSQALKYFLGESSKKKKAKRRILKRKYKKWKTKHKKLEKVVKDKDETLKVYHKDINTAINKWSKWKDKYHELEKASSTVGRRVAFHQALGVPPIFLGRGKEKRLIF